MNFSRHLTDSQENLAEAMERGLIDAVKRVRSAP